MEKRRDRFRVPPPVPESADPVKINPYDPKTTPYIGPGDGSRSLWCRRFLKEPGEVMQVYRNPGEKTITTETWARAIADWGVTPEQFLFVAEQLNDFRRGEQITLTITHRNITWSMDFALSLIWDANQAAEALRTPVGDETVGGRRQR